jgi:hypothetical protein
MKYHLLCFIIKENQTSSEGWSKGYEKFRVGKPKNVAEYFE